MPRRTHGGGLRVIKERCQAAGIPHQLVAAPHRRRNRVALRIDFPTVRGTRRRAVLEDDDPSDWPLQQVIEAPFEGLVFLEPYNAFFNTASLDIEAAVEVESLFEVAKRMSDDPHEEVHRDSPARLFDLSAFTPKHGSITLSRYSDLLTALSWEDLREWTPLSVKLRGAPGMSAEAALERLEGAADALLFDLDRKLNVAFLLAQTVAGGSGPSFHEGASSVGLKERVEVPDGYLLSFPTLLHRPFVTIPHRPEVSASRSARCGGRS